MCTGVADISSDVSGSDSDVIFFNPPYEPNLEDCWKCWSFPHNPLKKDVIVENPKYCRLYPRSERKKLRKVVPNFENVKILYTKCDYKLEEWTHNKILQIEDLLKQYKETWYTELVSQSWLIHDLWKNSKRYMLLTNSSCCVKYYPEIISKPMEEKVLSTFYKSLKKLNKSNRLLTESLRKIRNALKELDELCAQLDRTVESPFIQGNGAFQLPLDRIYAMVNDVFKSFHSNLCKLKCWAQLIDPGDSSSMEDYESLIFSVVYKLRDFLVFFNKEDCTCRRPKRLDCLKTKKPC